MMWCHKSQEGKKMPPKITNLFFEDMPHILQIVNVPTDNQTTNL